MSEFLQNQHEADGHAAGTEGDFAAVLGDIPFAGDIESEMEEVTSQPADFDPATGFAGDSLSTALDTAIETAEPLPTLDDYLRDARRNLMAMSRTAQGVVDTSASAGKADAMTGVTGDAAADLAQQNFDAAIMLAYENKDRDFASPQDLRNFIESLATTINQGIVKDGNLIRSADSAKYPYVRIANLEKYAQEFYDGLYQRTIAPDADPVEAAAYAEFGIDFAGHFFADGCGKTAKAVSTYMLMRAEHPLPEYKGGRAAYYANQLPVVAGEDAAADAAGYAKFLTYYRGLFDE